MSISRNEKSELIDKINAHVHGQVELAFIGAAEPSERDKIREAASRRRKELTDFIKQISNNSRG